MAAIMVLAGGLIGFFSAAVSMAFLGFGVMSALAVWSLLGLGFTLMGLLLGQMPGHKLARDAEAEAA